VIVRLSHPWKYHHTLDVLDTDAGDLTEPEARRLINAGFALDFDTIARPAGGGYFEVDFVAGTRRVRGRPAVLKALRREAGQ
jgi:hypothetical protein